MSLRSPLAGSIGGDGIEFQPTEDPRYWTSAQPETSQLMVGEAAFRQDKQNGIALGQEELTLV